MKTTKFLTFLLTALFFSAAFISCQKQNPTEQVSESRTDNAQLEKNLKMYEILWDDIINKGNINAINENSFTKDVVIIAAPENIVGIDAFKAYYQNYLTGFSDITFTINESFGQGDKLVKQWNFKGKHTGDFFGIPATGKSVNLDGVTIAEMQDGKIAQEQDFMDNMIFMQQLGMVPNPE